MLRSFATVTQQAPGDWFAVPIAEPDYVLGRIARFAGPAVLGYFFDGRHTLEQLEQWLVNGSPLADFARTVKVFSHLAFSAEKWPVALDHEDFELTNWPVPAFSREGFSADGLCHYAVRYSEDDLITVTDEWRIDEDTSRTMPPAGHAGAGYVREWLERLTLLPSSTTAPPDQPSR
jgi:hypothetical protein